MNRDGRALSRWQESPNNGETKVALSLFGPRIIQAVACYHQLSKHLVQEWQQLLLTSNYQIVTPQPALTLR